MIMVKNILLVACATFTLNGCVTASRAVLSPTDQTSSANNSASAEKCPPSALGPQYDAPVRQGAFNQELFDGAVRHFTNVKRCASGLQALGSDSKLRTAASGHSADMARLRFLEHESPVPGKREFTDRLDGAGVSYRSAAENLARNARLKIESGKPYKVVDRATCQFSVGGQSIEPHSYRTLAMEMVNDWERSPGHRKNLMSPKYRRVGSGGAHSKNLDNCGDVYATQNFAA